MYLIPYKFKSRSLKKTRVHIEYIKIIIKYVRGIKKLLLNLVYSAPVMN